MKRPFWKKVYGWATTLFAILFFVIFFREEYPKRIMMQLKYQPTLNRAELIENQSQYNLTGKNVFFGDSHIFSFATADPWFTRCDFANLGVGGQTTSDIMRRLPQFDGSRPAAIFLMMGINDFYYKQDEMLPRKNYQQIVRKLKETGAPIFVHSTLRLTSNENTYQSWFRFTDINEKVVGLNKHLKQMCEEEGVQFLDLDAKLTEDGNLRQEYSTDGVHLSKPAYAIWHEMLEPLIEFQDLPDFSVIEEEEFEYSIEAPIAGQLHTVERLKDFMSGKNYEEAIKLFSQEQQVRIEKIKDDEKAFGRWCLAWALEGKVYDAYRLAIKEGKGAFVFEDGAWKINEK